MDSHPVDNVILLADCYKVRPKLIFKVEGVVAYLVNARYATVIHLMLHHMELMMSE